MELSSIYDTAPVGLAVLDTELRFLRINERLAAINGLPVQQHIGRTVAEVLPDLASQAEQVLRRILETGEPLRDVELRGRTPAMPGVERVWMEQFTPLRDDAGKIVGISVVAEEVTEKRRLEQQIRSGQERLALALDAARLVMWDWDLQTDELDFALGDWGEQAGEDATRTMTEFRRLVHPDDHDRLDSCIEDHLSGRKPVYECEYRIRGGDGRYRWALSKGRIAARDATGQAIRMAGFRQDITAQKEADADRREQGQLLALAPDAIFVWSVRNGIERWNRGAERMYGYDAREALGQTSHQLLETEFPLPLQALLEHLRAHGTWRGELTHRRKDGARIRVEAVLQQVEGQPDRVLEITRDMTAEREARDRLAASERQLRTYRHRLDVALEAGRMGVWEWVPGTDRAYWSPQIFAFVGLPATEDGAANSAAFLDLVDPDDRPALDAELAKVLDQGGDYEAQFRLHPPAGSMRWLLSRGRVIHDEVGGGSRLIGINLDITKQKALEETLRQSEMRRNEFLAMLGHELRNPLAPITNAVRLLERNGPLDDRQTAAVQIIKRQSRHMARLVDDLLEVSRITQGRIELRMENLLVVTAVYAAVETARPLAREKGQRLDVQVEPHLDVVADPARLTQVLSNLIVNAVKYTPDGGHIRVDARARGERFVEIEVADNGMGISPELLPRIFELFTQDRRTLDRSEGGLGLGLALVKRLVELHGGRVECTSAGVGRGSTFSVCLPRHGRREELRSVGAQETTARIAPAAILIVDDNRDAAETMAALLELDGHRVSLAFDGPEALDVAARDVPNLVLLDIGLPRMNGLEVGRRMRAMPALAHTAIIGMSGYAQADDRAASRAAGFDAHLAKPAEVADVYRVLEKLRK